MSFGNAPARGGRTVRLPRMVLVVGLAAAMSSCRSPAPNAPVPTDAAGTRASVPVQLCALCRKPIPPGEEAVLVSADGKSEAFRCVHCALTAQAATPPPSRIHVRSPLSRTEITIERSSTGWRVSPSAAVFLSLPEKGGECMERHRAFPDREEYAKYLAAHPELPRDEAIPYTIGDLARLLMAGLPANGVRPDAPVQLLVVGMLTHLPFKEGVLPAIEGALDDAGSRVGARFVDATRPEGKAILAAHGIHEHLPVVMFLEGSSRATLAGRDVDLRGFPGSTWTREDLAALLRRAAAQVTEPSRLTTPRRTPAPGSPR